MLSTVSYFTYLYLVTRVDFELSTPELFKALFRGKNAPYFKSIFDLEWNLLNLIIIFKV